MAKSHISPQLAFSNHLQGDEAPYGERDGVLYQWLKTHWSAVSSRHLELLASDWLAENEPEKCNEKLAASCAATAIQRARPLPNAVNSLVPTNNGYVSVNGEDMVITPPDMSLGVTYCLSCNFAPEAGAKQFLSFLAEALPDAEVRSYLQEYAGYTLSADCRHQLGLWLIGGGGNGKSTFAQVIQALHRNPVSMHLDALDGFNLAGLVGASLVYCDETPTRIDEQRLKTLISGDSVQIDRKYRDPLVIRPTAKWIVSGNALPAISDHSDGFWRRWVILPFNTKPKAIQPELGDIIVRDELSGVLNWALEGLRRLIQRGKMPPLPLALADAQKTGKQQSNSVSAWVSDCDAVISGNTTSKKLTYHLYSGWCKRNGMKAVSVQKFWERVELLFSGKLLYSSDRTDDGQIRTVNLDFNNKDANRELFNRNNRNEDDQQHSPDDYEGASRGR